MKIQRLDPEGTPLQLISSYIGKGRAPQSHKVESVLYDSFDHWDDCTDCTVGTGAEERYARLSIAQTSRPNQQGQMYYQPQDKLKILGTDQVVEIVMTDTGRMKFNGSEITLTSGLTGNSTTATNLGDVVVRNVENKPIKDFGTSKILYMGRTIHESQKIEAESHMSDVHYDANFVEHKEDVLIFTEAQKNLMKAKHSILEWNGQQEEMIKRFKGSVENTLMWGERAENYDTAGRPTYHMRGLIPHIRSNVTMYDPTAITDFENLVEEFMLEQAFRYGPQNKIALVGPRFLKNFARAFKDYRRTDVQKALTPNMDIKSYEFLGKKLTLIPTPQFRLGTPLENWAVVCDFKEAEVMIKDNYTTRFWSNPDERDVKLMVEWRGTVRWNREEHYALLRTV